MPFSPIFTVSQSAEAPTTCIFTDSSTGSDVLITSRRIYITDSGGNAVVPAGTSTAYISWAYGTNPLTVLNLILVDTAVSVTVQWLDVSNAVLYEDDDSFCLAQNNKQFFYYLIQQQGLTPSIVQDANYFSNLAMYWTNIIGAIQAIEDASDLAGSQNCLNRATEMMTNESKYF